MKVFLTLSEIQVLSNQEHIFKTCVQTTEQHLFTEMVKRTQVSSHPAVNIHPVFGGVNVAHRYSVLCCVFVLCLSTSCVVCAQWCHCLWVVHSWLPLRFVLPFIICNRKGAFG